jgi:hypothetical protein
MIRYITLIDEYSVEYKRRVDIDPSRNATLGLKAYEAAKLWEFRAH